MHKEVIEFFKDMKDRWPQHFSHHNEVLEIGARDINGSVRHLFSLDVKIYGCDLTRGPGVDIVQPVHEISGALDGIFTVVFSTEHFEHDKHWKESLVRMAELTAPNGLMIFTCAGPSRGEHGTTEFSPEDSPDTNDWYQNLTVDDISRELLPTAYFSKYECYQSRDNHDLNFWGVRK